ncbi:MAG TPA: MerR family transcriptional regulator [Acidimicrobiales bacterium]|jgi:DNA-binding transcriptional MerR regulator|nr:MerR family transcriptional regulator [Acidimicrobiales bacterium]
MSTSSSHRSIGEVLGLLKDEFPDITISKIRFLESQGLLDPERTPSGYRRFYDKDVERLRWILRQQREHFLPLKVIKGRLADGGDTPEAVSVTAEAATVTAEASTTTTEPRPEPSGAQAPEPSAAGGARPARRLLPEPALFSQRPAGSEFTLERRLSDTAASLTADELAAATGLTLVEVADLERYGLVEHRSIGATPVYDEDALLVARLVAAFLVHGVEARHLRMYKVAADREAGVFEQIVLPLARQRTPDARRRVNDALTELGRLGESLHAAMLQRALKHVT